MKPPPIYKHQENSLKPSKVFTSLEFSKNPYTNAIYMLCTRVLMNSIEHSTTLHFLPSVYGDGVNVSKLL